MTHATSHTWCSSYMQACKITVTYLTAPTDYIQMAFYRCSSQMLFTVTYIHIYVCNSIVRIWYCVLWVSQQLLVANLVELNRAPCQSCAPAKGSLEAGGRLRHSRGQPLGRDCHLTLIEHGIGWGRPGRRRWLGLWPAWSATRLHRYSAASTLSHTVMVAAPRAWHAVFRVVRCCSQAGGSLRARAS